MNNPFTHLLRQRLYDDNAKDHELLAIIHLAQEIEKMVPGYGDAPLSGGAPFRYAYRFLEKRFSRNNSAVRHLLDLHLTDMIQD